MTPASYYSSFSDAWLKVKGLDFLTRIASFAMALIPLTMFLGPFLTDLCISLISITFLARSYRQASWSWLYGSWVKLFLSFWLFMLVRSTWALDPIEAFTHSVLLVRYGLLTVAMAHWLVLKDEVRTLLLYGTLFAVSFAVIDGLVQFLVGFDLLGKPPHHHSRLTGPLNRPRLGLTLAWLGVPLISIALAKLVGSIFQQKERLWLWGLLSFGVLLVGVASGDRGGLLEMLLGITLLGCLGAQYRRYLFKLAFFAPVALALVYAYNPATFDRQVFRTIETIQHFSSSDYGVVYRGGLHTFLDYPLFGVGARQYRDICSQNHSDIKMETSPGSNEYKWLNDRYHCGYHPHNLYLELLSESGVLGFCLFFALFITILRLAWQYRKLISQDAFVLGCVAVLLSRLFPALPAGSVYVVWSSVPLWLMLGVIWGACLRYANHSSSMS